MAEKREHKAAIVAAINKELKVKPGVTERSARALRLKTELNQILELVVEMRVRLENELKDSAQQKFIDKGFIDKVNKLSQSYERLTSARIALDKAEKAMEAEMTPAEEIDAVRNFILAMDSQERGKFFYKIKELLQRRNEPIPEALGLPPGHTKAVNAE